MAALARGFAAHARPLPGLASLAMPERAVVARMSEQALPMQCSSEPVNDRLFMQGATFAHPMMGIEFPKWWRAVCAGQATAVELPGLANASMECNGKHRKSSWGHRRTRGGMNLYPLTVHRQLPGTETRTILRQLRYTP